MDRKGSDTETCEHTKRVTVFLQGSSGRWACHNLPWSSGKLLRAYARDMGVALSLRRSYLWVPARQLYISVKGSYSPRAGDTIKLQKGNR